MCYPEIAQEAMRRQLPGDGDPLRNHREREGGKKERERERERESGRVGEWESGRVGE